MNAEALARLLHELYEQAAKTVGWSTQESCQVDFNDLPEKNKQTMVQVAEKLLETFEFLPKTDQPLKQSTTTPDLKFWGLDPDDDYLQIVFQVFESDGFSDTIPVEIFYRNKSEVATH